MGLLLDTDAAEARSRRLTEHRSARAVAGCPEGQTSGQNVQSDRSRHRFASESLLSFVPPTTYSEEQKAGRMRHHPRPFAGCLLPGYSERP
jgi:hypothetical protein